MRSIRRVIGSGIAFALAACGGSSGAGDAGGSATTSGNADTDATGAVGTDATSASDPDASGSATDTGASDSVDPTADGTVGETTADETTTTSDDDSSTDDGTTGVGGEPNVLYVRDDGENGDPGTVEAPMRTIQWAIEQAVIQGGIDTIRVAQGNYGVDYANDDHIVMVDGVSLYGGYRSDWGDRDPNAYVTQIVDEAPSAIPSSDSDPHRSIEIPAGVGADTVFDGFHVGITRGQFRAAVFVQGDASIHGNVLVPTTDAEAVRVTGVRIIDADPSVTANHIALQLEQTAGLIDGVLATNTNGLFANNVIDLTGGGNNLNGFTMINGGGTIVANSVWAPDTVNVYMVQLHGNASPVIDNNLFESQDLTAVCINSLNAAAVPTALRNNVLNCYYTLFGIDPLRSWTTIMELQDNLAAASDNLKLPDNLVGPDDDMVLDGQSPCTVTQGGRDVSAQVEQDVAGIDRTVPLSIGAHEWDGGCQ